ncbi:uncharacterized protein LOC102808639 isoform X2 [Saccoglossus kowalevskii]
MTVWTMVLDVLFLFLCWFGSANCLPLVLGRGVVPTDLQVMKTNSGLCDIWVGSKTDESDETTKSVFYKGKELTNLKLCRLMMDGIHTASQQNGIVDVECTLTSGEVIHSCFDMSLRDVNHAIGRKLLSSDLQWIDTAGSDGVSTGTVIGAVSGLILLLVAVAMCVGKKKKASEPVTVSKTGSGEKVTMEQLKNSLKKCESSSEIENDKADGPTRKSNTLDNHNLEVPRPSSQVSTSSHDSTQMNNKQGVKEPIERRLPQPPPMTPPAADDDDDDDTYASVDKEVTGYSKLKDPNYSKIKNASKNSEDAKDLPNYERIKLVGEEEEEAEAEGAIGGAEDDTFYTAIPNDSYAKVNKDRTSKMKADTKKRDSSTSDSLYSSVSDGDGAPPPVPQKAPDLDMDSPGTSRRGDRTASQSSTGSASATSRMLPQQPLPMVTSSSQSASSQEEPNYTQVSVRESIESIKEREGKKTTHPYTAVTEEPNYYSVVNSVQPPSPTSPPPLPSDNTRPTSSVQEEDISVSVKTRGVEARTRVNSALYEKISGEIDDEPQETSAPIPEYASVNKSKKSKGPTDVSALYSKVNKSRKKIDAAPNRENQRSSSRISKSSDDGDVDYSRIKDNTDATDPGYQAIDELNADLAAEEKLKADDMVHISQHKVDEGFWQKKDHTYQTIHGQEEDEEEEKQDKLWNTPD